MNSRERVNNSINYIKSDKVPVDFGATDVTGISVSIVSKLRDYYGLPNDSPVKVIEPYQILGEIEEDLGKLIGIDCMPAQFKKNIFGFENKNWKEWRLSDGTPVLVPEDFNTKVEKDGYIYQYPEGDTSAKPSAKMPKEGYYFDSIIRQYPLDDNNLNVSDNLEEFELISDDDLNYFKDQVDFLYDNTDYAIMASIPGISFGDAAFIPAPSLKDPRGIRDIQEWYISYAIRKKYIYSIFERQCEIALKNLEKIFKTVDNKLDVVFTTGTDFGTQRGSFISNDLYRELFKPFHEKINFWIHQNTKWKVFIHSCGSVKNLIPEFINSGFDILNPVQISATEMEAEILKKEFGRDIVFWGGGIDTQKTLPFGTVKDVKNETLENLKTFSEGGGFVFSTVHNIQAKTPIDNVATMINTVNKFNGGNNG